MCKVLGIVGLNDKNRGTAIKILKEMSVPMTNVEKDGFGYAAINAQGEVFGEKWLSTSQAMVKRPKWVKNGTKTEDIDNKLISKFRNILVDATPSIDNDGMLKNSGYAKFGNDKLENAVAIIAHSRFATVDACTINEVHPFYHPQDNIALVHNGIIKNHKEFLKMYSECDSEILLHQYANSLVNMDSRVIADAVKDVQGYYACLVLTQAMDDKEVVYPALDIFKFDASLDIVYVDSLNLTVFCTKGTLVKKVCEKLQLRCSSSFEVKEELLMRFNAVTGELIETEKFKGYEVKFTGQTYLTSRYGNEYPYGTMEDYYKFGDGDSDDWDVPAYREDSPAKNIIDATKESYDNYKKANDAIVKEELKKVK